MTGPLPFSSPYEWPRYERDWRRTRVWVVLAGLVAFALEILAIGVLAQ